MRNTYQKCAYCGTLHERNHLGLCSVCFEDTWFPVCRREIKCIANSDGCTRCDFRFRERLFHDPSQLASELVTDWDEACIALQRHPIHHWATDGLDDTQLARQLKAVAKDTKLDGAHGGLRLAATFIVLNRNCNVLWRTEEITPQWIEQHPADAIAILDSSLPEWVQRLRGEGWLAALASRWIDLRNYLQKSAAQVSEATALKWLLKTPEQTGEALRELRHNFAGSTNFIADRLFQKELLNEQERILLLVLDRNNLKSRQEIWEAEALECVHNLNCLLRDVQMTPTKRRTLERLSVNLDSIWMSHLARCEALANDRVVLVVHDEARFLENECRHELGVRLLEHARQRDLRIKLQELAHAGHIGEAERLAGSLNSQFLDLELNPVYRVIALFRRLRLITKVATMVFVMVLILAVIRKFPNVHSLSPEPLNFLLPGGVALRLLPVPVGKFQMGSAKIDSEAEADEKPLTLVSIGHPFWLAETEITQAQWKSVMGTDLLAHQVKHHLTNGVEFVGNDLPMMFVSWDEAQSFCAKLQTILLRENYKGVVRLPTEAEWEYACRAGTKTTFSFGVSANPTNGNFAPSAGPAVVKSFTANPWGFFDLHGNVAEWVRGAPVPYPGRQVVDWRVPENNKDRLHRGGSWRMPSTRSRSAARNWRLGGNAAEHVGFRVVLQPTS